MPPRESEGHAGFVQKTRLIPHDLAVLGAGEAGTGRERPENHRDLDRRQLLTHLVRLVAAYHSRRELELLRQPQQAEQVMIRAADGIDSALPRDGLLNDVRLR